MEAAMAPPVKRRKLSDSTPLDIHQDNRTEPLEVHSFSHTVQISYDSPEPQTTGQSVPDSHQAVEVDPEDYKVLLRRQAGTTAGVPQVSTGIQIFTDASTTLTYTPPALPSLPTLPSVPGATTFSTTPSSTIAASSTETSSTSSSSLSNSTSTDHSTSDSLTTSAIIFEGNTTTTTSKTTLTVTSTSRELYTATLPGGQVSTVTRSETAYITTFPGGAVFTIPGLYYTRSSSSRTASDTESGTDQGTFISTATVDFSPAATDGSYGSPTDASPSSATTPGLAPGGGGGGGGGNNDTPPAGTIAGGVVGGCAGLAVVVLIAMLFVRWYRRRSQMGHQALPPVYMGSPEAEQPGQSRGPGMAERAGLMPFAAAVPALFRHSNRSTNPSESSERGFTRISGRKLPSAFSEGMSSGPPPNMPVGSTLSGPDERKLSSTSFYRNSHGFYGGDGTRESTSSPTASPTSPASSRGPLRNSTHEMMMMSPGPQRQPQVHSGGPYEIHSPSTATTAAFQRSDTPSSLDPSRNSRFTEEM